MVPQPRFNTLARKQYVAGEYYTLGITEDRSSASHRHYFACVAEAHRNLPEDKVARYPTDDHLRYWALIKAGWHKERSYVCESRKQAETFAAFMEDYDEFAVILLKGNVVKVYTAKSQSTANMTREDFEKSKADVLAILSEVIGVTTKQLETEGRISS